LIVAVCEGGPGSLGPPYVVDWQRSAASRIGRRRGGRQSSVEQYFDRRGNPNRCDRCDRGYAGGPVDNFKKIFFSQNFCVVKKKRAKKNFPYHK
jgi:hypothetical protein